MLREEMRKLWAVLCVFLGHKTMTTSQYSDIERCVRCSHWRALY